MEQPVWVSILLVLQHAQMRLLHLASAKTSLHALSVKGEARRGR